MCRKCTQSSVKPGDKVWKAMIDDTGDKLEVVVAWAKVLTKPSKHLEVRIRLQDDTWGVFGYHRTVVLKYVAHSEADALQRLLEEVSAAEAEAQARVQLVRKVVKKAGVAL